MGTLNVITFLTVEERVFPLPVPSWAKQALTLFYDCYNLSITASDS